MRLIRTFLFNFINIAIALLCRDHAWKPTNPPAGSLKPPISQVKV